MPQPNGHNDTYDDDDEVQRILDQCLSKDMHEWSQAVADACSDHPELADELRLRFDALKAAGLVGDSEASGETPRYAAGSNPDLEMPIREIGPYRLGDVLGQGGMGTVYRAEQSEPIARTVAVKLIRAGLDTTQTVARFEAERRALALMNHPHIARVLDAGATPEGRPFVVMELVEGTAITQYANQHDLGLEARLRLWIQVCEAVQHAHQKGMLHRDIKPSNVLVTEVDGKPVPKVIDFGLARALDNDVDADLTRHGQALGTPSYMSPEQALPGERDVDSRADVYALGVLGFELLTGAPPLDHETVSQSTWPELVHLIQERPAPRPSSRLASMDPARARRLRGDLDWIIQKALEKERDRRYTTVAALADDIERHLAHQPVLASAPGMAYLMRKFLRRYRLQVGAGALVLLALIGGTIGTAIGLQRSERTNRELRQVAEFQSAQLKDIVLSEMGADLREGVITQVRTALQRDGTKAPELDARIAKLEDLVGNANFTNLARDTLKKNVFERALVAIDENFANQPLVQARLLQTVARTLRDLSLLDMALAPQRRAIALRREHLGNEHVDTLESLNAYGVLLGIREDWPAAERLYREALRGRRKALGPDHQKTVDTLNNLALTLTQQDRAEEAEPLYIASVASSRRALGPEHEATLTAMNNLATMYDLHGAAPEKAVDLHRQVLEIRRRVLGNDHRDTLASIINLCQCIDGLGKAAEAAPLGREAIEISRRMLGDMHILTLSALHVQANVLVDLDLAEAELLRRESVAGFASLVGDKHAKTRIMKDALMDLLVNKAALAFKETRLGDSESALLEAHQLSIELESPRPEAYIVAQLITVYERLHEREPDKGHDARAESWRKKQ